MAKYFVYSLFLLIHIVARSQDAQYSQYYAAPLYLNPALTGISQNGTAGINFRNQWPQISSSFNYYSFYTDYYFANQNTAVGLMANSENAGISGLQTNSAHLLVAYQFKGIFQWVFRPGLQVSYINRRVDFSKLKFGDQFDGTGLINETTGESFENNEVNTMDFSFGGVLFNRKGWFGFSVHHLAEPNFSLIASGSNILSRKISFHGGYKFSINKMFKYSKNEKERSITPSFNFKTQSGFNQLDLGVFFTFEPILIGTWYRGFPFKNVDNVINNDAIITMIGLKYKSFNVGYSYDFTISNLGIESGGAHEISISYLFRFGEKILPHHIKELSCPIPLIYN